VITGDRKISSQQLSHLNPRSDDIGVELFRATPKKSRAATRHHAAASSSSSSGNLGCVNSRPAAHLLQVAPIPHISLKTLLRFARDFATMNFERMITIIKSSHHQIIKPSNHHTIKPSNHHTITPSNYLSFF